MTEKGSEGRESTREAGERMEDKRGKQTVEVRTAEGSDKSKKRLSAESAPDRQQFMTVSLYVPPEWSWRYM
jgi:hypothetical protein